MTLRRIALVADWEDWILGRHAQEFKAWLLKHRKAQQVDLYFHSNLDDLKFQDAIRKYDAIVYMDLGMMAEVFKRVDPSWYVGRDVPMVVSEYWYRTWSLRSLNRRFIEKYLRHRTRYLTMSPMVDASFKEAVTWAETCQILQGVPADYGSRVRTKPRRKSDTLVVGWAGRGDSDAKNVRLLMAIADQAMLDLEPIEFRLAGDRFPNELIHMPNVNHVGKLKPEDMPGFYASLDVLVCTSKTEAGPAPVLEALACGVSVVSTNVGMVPLIRKADPLIGLVTMTSRIPRRWIQRLKAMAGVDPGPIPPQFQAVNAYQTWWDGITFALENTACVSPF